MVSARVVHVTLSVRIPQVVGAHLHVVGAHLRMIGLHLRGVGAHQCVVASMYEKWLEIGLVKVYISNLWLTVEGDTGFVMFDRQQIDGLNFAILYNVQLNKVLFSLRELWFTRMTYPTTV